MTGFGLTFGYIMLRGNEWQSGTTLHTVMETAATLLAFVAGTMALLRYYSKKDSLFLFIGVGFLGTGFLDGYHALVTSAYFKPYMPSDLPDLIPWSWVASRQFLSIMMAVSWFVWWRENSLGIKSKFSERTVYIISILFTVVSFLFFAFFPLPPAYYPDAFFHRPEEFAPAFFFLIALIGYLAKGRWKNDAFEHWLVLSLIIGFVSQAVFMSFSNTLFDLEFDIAHTLKKVSYVCVLTGLLYSMHAIFRREEDVVRELDFQKSAMDQHAIVTITDANGNITYCNDLFCEISGFSREELMGKNHRYVKSDEHPPELYADLWRTISRGKTWHGVIKNRKKQGGHYWAAVTIVPFLDKTGKPVKYVAIRTDITERKAAETALIASREDALAAVKAKSNFLANMSHEIRTPMNGVIGMLELLKGLDLTSQQSDYVDTALQSADMQISVINDILDFSKIESGHLDLEYTDFNLCGAVEDIAALLSATAQSKGVVLTCFCDPRIPSAVLGDPTRLRQILANLAGNAVKFTNQGEVNISALFVSHEGNKVTIKLQIQDTGIGIDHDQLALLFQAFSQADASTTRKFGGTGLGLAISKTLVELMGSQIQVESEKGEGSTFSFTLVMDVGQSMDVGSVDDLEDMRVLVVDDNATNREILQSYLSSWGMNAIATENAEKALAYLKSTDKTIDLAILDFQMPDMNGLQLAEVISNDTAIKAPPMVMLSSSLPGDQQTLRDAGIMYNLSKPVGRSKLLDMILRATGQTVVKPSPAKSAPRATISGHILLVEDTFINQQVAIGILTKLGLSVDVANNGQECLEKIFDQPYDLVFMDIQMPVMDGLQATAAIRQREEQDDLPHTAIIAMTAHALKEDRQRCIDAGMDDYLAKPVRIDTIEAVLKKWLEV